MRTIKFVSLLSLFFMAPFCAYAQNADGIELPQDWSASVDADRNVSLQYNGNYRVKNVKVRFEVGGLFYAGSSSWIFAYDADVFEQVTMIGGRDAIDLVVRAHNHPGIAFLDADLEWFQIDLAESPLIDLGIIEETRGLLVVASIML